jgi:hypothetical protein
MLTACERYSTNSPSTTHALRPVKYLFEAFYRVNLGKSQVWRSIQSTANYSPPNSLLTGKNTGKLGSLSTAVEAIRPFTVPFSKKSGIS